MELLTVLTKLAMQHSTVPNGSTAGIHCFSRRMLSTRAHSGMGMHTLFLQTHAMHMRNPHLAGQLLQDHFHTFNDRSCTELFALPHDALQDFPRREICGIRWRWHSRKPREDPCIMLGFKKNFKDCRRNFGPGDSGNRDVTRAIVVDAESHRSCRNYISPKFKTHSQSQSFGFRNYLFLPLRNLRQPFGVSQVRKKRNRSAYLWNQTAALPQ